MKLETYTEIPSLTVVIEPMVSHPAEHCPAPIRKVLGTSSTMIVWRTTITTLAYTDSIMPIQYRTETHLLLDRRNTMAIHPLDHPTNRIAKSGNTHTMNAFKMNVPTTPALTAHMSTPKIFTESTTCHLAPRQSHSVSTRTVYAKRLPSPLSPRIPVHSRKYIGPCRLSRCTAIPLYHHPSIVHRTTLHHRRQFQL
jgi:hypothetical protein